MTDFHLKRFIKNSNLTSREVVSITGYNKNTITKWCMLKTDEKIPLDFIYKLMKIHPHLEYKKHFPTYRKILNYNKDMY